MRISKREVHEIADKYNMEILRHHITREAWGLGLKTDHEIAELNDLQERVDKRGTPPGVHDIEMVTDRYPDGTIYYKIYCPFTWFDLAGWTGKWESENE